MIGSSCPLVLKRVAVPVCLMALAVLTTKTGDPLLPGELHGSPYVVPDSALRPLPPSIPRATAPAAPLPPPVARVLSEPLPSLYIGLEGIQRLLNNRDVLNPTGGDIRRHDAWGDGSFRAGRYDPKTRKRSKHKGVDFVGAVGAPVVSPIGGRLRRAGQGFTTGVVILGNIHGKPHRILLLHFNPTVRDGYVAQGQVIGRVRKPDRRYRRMTPHVHLEIAERRGDSLLKVKNPLHMLRADAR